MVDSFEKKQQSKKENKNICLLHYNLLALRFYCTFYTAFGISLTNQTISVQYTIKGLKSSIKIPTMFPSSKTRINHKNTLLNNYIDQT